MANVKRWSWILLFILALAALVFPAILQARPIPAEKVATAAAAASTTVTPDEWTPSPSRSSWTISEQDEAQNLALCTATGFAGGFTVFLCISGWGVFRVAMPRNAALGAFVSATAASLVGFLLGFNGFLHIVGS